MGGDEYEEYEKTKCECGSRLTLDDLEEMDPEEIEAWQEAHAIHHDHHHHNEKEPAA